MVAPATGLHHITCVCQDWQRTRTFYEALGFPLVKNTVNHDAPESRHTYHAAPDGAPGTTITFFEWPSTRAGRPGHDSAPHVGLRLGSELDLGLAAERLDTLGRPRSHTEDVYGACLETKDPDGLALRLYAGEAPTPALHHAALYGHREARAAFYEDLLGLPTQRHDQGPWRVDAPDGAPNLMLLDGEPGPGRIAPGAVHHVALAAQDEDHQDQLREHLLEADVMPTEPIDRIYFRSIYFRDPGGHIVEIATPEPGFTADEPLARLGQSLVLPSWLEDQRDKIEAALGDR
ncbi:MAG: VOC family protein [Candidatus Thermoplasmatota archaeon]|nr:VOC family protein [Candidatus Thermoplasmatota archaeon]